jgi:hypothetical protein
MIIYLKAKYQTIKLETLASNIQNLRPTLMKTKIINNKYINNTDNKSQQKQTCNNQNTVKYNSSSLSRLSNESSSFSTTSSSSSASSTTSNNRANSFEYDFDSDFASLDFVLNNEIGLNNLNGQVQKEERDNNNNNQISNKNKNSKKIVNVHHHNLRMKSNDENTMNQKIKVFINF